MGVTLCPSRFPTWSLTMTCQITRYVPVEQMAKLDQLVKIFNGRYVNGTHYFGDQYYVVLEFDSVDDLNKYEHEFLRQTTNIIEKHAPKWNQLWNRLILSIRWS